VITHPADWWVDHEVEVLTGTRVDRVDAARSTLMLTGGREMPYDRVLVATGGRARRIPTFEADERVRYLRTIEDARTMGALLSDIAARGGRVVVIGGGFIGCEVASTARTLGVDVTVVEVLDSLVQRVLGRRYGSVMTEVAAGSGVDVRCGRQVEKVTARPGWLLVETDDGGAIEADMVVIAAGMVPNTELVEGSGVALVGAAILVDELCKASVGKVFAAGDVVAQSRTGRPTPVHVEHQDTAQRQGRVAATAMLDTPRVDPTPDWFWSDQFGLSIQSVGHFDPDANHVVRGSIDEALFTAFQTEGDRLIGALSVGRPADIRTARRLIAAGATVDLVRLGDPGSNLKEVVMERSQS
jgi:3-phenylpropionate/trans-cinnamate dioxygenase ferredoxin reductase subunit